MAIIYHYNDPKKERRRRVVSMLPYDKTTQSRPEGEIYCVGSKRVKPLLAVLEFGRRDAPSRDKYLGLSLIVKNLPVVIDIAAVRASVGLAMATPTKDAIFRYHLYNVEEITHLEYTHPVPTFLCTPSPSQRGSKQYLDAFVDVVSIINAQHHEECMAKITTPCVICGKPAKDLVKSPMSYLHLAQPMVTIQTSQICGDKRCEMRVRTQLGEMQKQIVEGGTDFNGAVFEGMSCETCGKPNAKRCVGCGQVAYCNQACQKARWKKHKKECHRRKNVDSEDPLYLPYEAI